MQKKQHIVRILRAIMIPAGIVSIVIFPPWDLIWTWLAPLPETIQEQIDDAIDHGLDGIILYVDQAGEAPVFYSAGWKNKATQAPADPHALFKIASISKLYVATAAAKLASNQSLPLDGSLADHLPELVGRIEYADRITLRMLLQHRSGIPNYTDHDEFDWFTPPKDINNSLELVLDEPAESKPDSRYSYSNTNYLLIGRILDKALGYNHQQYIAREILTPLGLTNTYSLLSQVDLEEVASGYWYQHDDDLKHLDYLSPSGSMVATAQDVGIFLRALNDGSLLNGDEQAIYSTIYEYEHAGWLPGYHSIARYHEGEDTVVIQFVNTTGGERSGLATIVYDRIVKILHRQ